MKFEAIVTGPHGEVRYVAGFLDRGQADDLTERLEGEIDWQQWRITMFGRQIDVPRLSAWYGDPGARYAYSGLELEPRPWTTALGDISRRVEAFCGTRFNSVLANLYRDGGDSMGWHADDEPELGAEPVIASLSLGGERRFCLRQVRGRERGRKTELVPGHGSLVTMSGPLQRYWQHGVPKTRKPAGRRINLTFRRIIGDAGQ